MTRKYFANTAGKRSPFWLDLSYRLFVLHLPSKSNKPAAWVGVSYYHTQHFCKALSKWRCWHQGLEEYEEQERETLVNRCQQKNCLRQLPWKKWSHTCQTRFCSIGRNNDLQKSRRVLKHSHLLIKLYVWMNRYTCGAMKFMMGYKWSSGYVVEKGWIQRCAMFLPFANKPRNKYLFNLLCYWYYVSHSGNKYQNRRTITANSCCKMSCKPVLLFNKIFRDRWMTFALFAFQIQALCRLSWNQKNTHQHFRHRQDNMATFY